MEVPTNDVLTTASQALAAAIRAGGDSELISLWLHGLAPHTQRAYTHDVARFLAFVDRPLVQVNLRDLQAFADSLVALQPGSQARALAAIKSLLTFAQKAGLLVLNVGLLLELPRVKDSLAERIMPQDIVLQLIHAEPKPRNAAILRLLYVAGLRVSELCDLCWRDVQPVAELGQITVFGKGGKTRAIRLTATIWQTLERLRGAAGADEPVFRSKAKGGGHLDPSQVRRIVYAAAKRAGLADKISPHWFRHAHASHSLDAGCPIHLVQATLGHASVSTTGRYLHARPTDSSSRFLPA